MKRRPISAFKNFSSGAVLALVLFLALSVPTFAQSVSPASPTLMRLRASNVITLAHRESSIPFSYLDADKRPVGYSIDLCLRVVDSLRRELKLPNLRVRYLKVSAAERIPALTAGQADLECGNTTNTADRRKQVAFSVTHYFAGGRLLVRTGSGVKRLADLYGRAIVANSGSTHAQYISAAIKKGVFTARLVEAKDSAEAFDLLQKKAVDAYLHDDIVLASLKASSSAPEAFELVGEYTTLEPLAIMLRKDDAEFKRFVDVALSRLMIDGDLKNIWARWFQSPIPPQGITLHVPMNDLMRDQVRFPSDKVGDEIGG